MIELIDHYKRVQHRFIGMCGSIVGPKQARKVGTAVFLLFSGAMTEAQNLKARWPLEDALAAAEALCEVHAAVKVAV